jgi:hypothetical protein
MSCPNNLEDDEIYQVYIDRWDPGEIVTPVSLSHTQNVIAVPVRPENLNDGIISRSIDFDDLIDRLYNETFPWTIHGKIVDGKMGMKFPTGNLALDSKYESNFTEGTRIAKTNVMSTDERWVEYALKKFIDDPLFSDHRILIYYASADFNKFNNGTVRLKAGLNFIESYLDRSGGVYGTWKVGLISQNIYDFFDMGYRWFFDGG